MKKKDTFVIGVLSALIVTFAVLGMFFDNKIFSLVMLMGLCFENLYLWNMNRQTINTKLAKLQLGSAIIIAICVIAIVLIKIV